MKSVLSIAAFIFLAGCQDTSRPVDHYETVVANTPVTCKGYAYIGYGHGNLVDCSIEGFDKLFDINNASEIIVIYK